VGLDFWWQSVASITLGTTGGATNNQIVTVNGVSYTYDAAGDVTSDGLHSCQYDCRAELLRWTPEEQVRPIIFTT
jgi:hypothetical protein